MKNEFCKLCNKDLTNKQIRANNVYCSRKCYIDDKEPHQNCAAKLKGKKKTKQHCENIKISKKYMERVGQKFGKWTVIELLDKKSSNGSKVYICQCECGKTTKIASGELGRKERKSNQCKSCYARQHSLTTSNCYEEITNTFWGAIKNSANHRKMEFLLTKEYIWNLFIEQNRKCKISGIDINFMPIGINKDDKKKLEKTVSLDRINSKVGYIEGNVQWLHKEINLMKNSLSDLEFINFCNIIHKFQLNPIFQYDNSKNFSILNITQSYFGNIKEKKKREFNITKEYIFDLFVQQSGRCKFSGIPLYLPRSYKDYSKRTASLDRIDSSQGYVKCNVQWVYRKINFIKKAMTDQKLIEMCSIVTNYQKNKGLLI